MNRTEIEWVVNPDGTRGKTWNPKTGCRRLCRDDSGKIYCYAYWLAITRLKHKYPMGFEPYLWEDRLDEPNSLRKPTSIFCCSMGEPLDNLKWAQRILKVQADNPKHFFFNLTKRPENLEKVYFPVNARVGVSITRQQQACYKSFLKNIKDKDCIRFISFEPLLEEIEINLEGVDWIIIGGKTGHRPFHPPVKWVTSLIEEATRVGAYVFVKDNCHYPQKLQQLARGDLP